MKEKEVTKLRKSLWDISNIVVEDARGALSGIYTLWNKQEVSLIHSSSEMQHWILTKFYHNQSNIIFSIIKVYMPEKSKCLGSISNSRNYGLNEPCIIVGDLNLISTSSKKEGDIQ